MTGTAGGHRDDGGRGGRTIDVEVVETSSLGDRSYLAHDGEVGVVVDPQRDIDRFLALAGRLGVRITQVVETHLHNDYLSGGLTLARVTGASYLMAGDEDVAFERTAVADGARVEASDALALTAVATPGHTFHHLSYVLEGPDGPVGAFTGGSLLYGATGRTDLLGAAHARRLALRQHASARRLADLLPDAARLWPTHGFGSFCAVGGADTDASTVGREKKVNPVFRLEAADFAAELLAGLDAYPAYYAHMGVRNAAGAALLDLTRSRPVDPAGLRARLDAGQWVVDLRARRAFARGHLAGTVSVGLDGAMATWVGWLLPAGAPLTLLADSAEALDEARRELARVGVDRPDAAPPGTPEDWAASSADVAAIPAASFADLARALAGDPPRGLPVPAAVLDVRLGHEWREGHLEGAVHVPLPELPSRLAALPAGPVWTHCASGYRAALAASLLPASHSPVFIDDSFDRVGETSLRLVHG